MSGQNRKMVIAYGSNAAGRGKSALNVLTSPSLKESPCPNHPSYRLGSFTQLDIYVWGTCTRIFTFVGPFLRALNLRAKWPIFHNFALKFKVLKNSPRKVKELVVITSKEWCLLLRQQVASQSREQYTAAKSGRVWHESKISFEIPTWDNS